MRTQASSGAAARVTRTALSLALKRLGLRLRWSGAFRRAHCILKKVSDQIRQRARLKQSALVKCRGVADQFARRHCTGSVAQKRPVLVGCSLPQNWATVGMGGSKGWFSRGPSQLQDQDKWSSFGPLFKQLGTLGLTNSMALQHNHPKTSPFTVVLELG